MRKILFVIIILIYNPLFGQIDFSAGMGISFINNSSLNDYVNANYSGSGDNLRTFNSAVDFFVEGDYNISESFQLGLEYNLSFFSFTTPLGILGNYDLDYLHHKPSVIAYYVISGEGYKFKFGGGGGPRLISLDEKFPFVQGKANYTSSGIGLLMKAQGHTLLGGNFYANIGVDLRYDLPGEPENGGNNLFNNVQKENVNINSFSLGLKLGVSYFL